MAVVIKKYAHLFYVEYFLIFLSSNFSWNPPKHFNNFPGLDNLSDSSSEKTPQLLRCLRSLHKAPVCIREWSLNSSLRQRNNPHIIELLASDLWPHGQPGPDRG